MKEKVCELCGKPATMSYHGVMVCIDCYNAEENAQEEDMQE